ncbi:Six-hairpin glycosidase-like protein [Dactylonectria macrodidyma]|uniref:Six-hairpin glycosidase-like protein n=1 Tax=Dactylonectria macrodidyma TaxID=307937 RepID=A0A9P9EHX0_9HYPO|nr:Six-hairpin glycosidase-like protein [Dactylonectria macrodidyma]
MKTISMVLAVLAFVASADAKELWSSKPAGYASMRSSQYLLKTGFPVGNGKLGAIPFGSPGAEKVNLNVDSLWSGGPFEVENYQGGNPSTPRFQNLPDIRSRIFTNGTGSMNALLGNRNYYGSNRVLGNLTVSFEGAETFGNYRRSLDLVQGVHQTSFTMGNDSSEVVTTVFCSFPNQACVYYIESSEILPTVTVGLENLLVEQTLVNTSCADGFLHHTGITQVGPPEGMRYVATVAFDAKEGSASCSSNGKVGFKPSGKTLTIFWSADTNFDQRRGNGNDGWTFRGADPSSDVKRISKNAASKGYASVLKAHTSDFKKLQGAFTLEVSDPQGSKEVETSTLIQNYKLAGPGDPYLESLLFDLSRYLLITSSRENSLPANLQGRWTELLKPSWGADYHANINLQMNYWVADQTGLAATQKSLWDYMQDTWVPRGTETAKLLYNATGWVVHDEMNIFGFTAMKDVASWANYPIAPAWMMQHVWDAFEYTQDVKWLREQGYPLIKGVAGFWVSSLQEDLYTEDGSLVAVPCNSAETGPTTFGCAHFQQLIYQVFDATLAAADVLSETDQKFVSAVSSTLARLDTGLHFASWGGLKEWKMPESLGFDKPSTHRHLSHLNGWYPGYSISSFANGYTNETIQDAVRETLVTRGMGNAADANAGWAKVWRSACWARLNETEKAYDQLRFAIEQNFAANGFSMYAGRNPPFQIDANFGFGGAVLSMLVVDLPLPAGVQSPRVVVLGPAIPKAWGKGQVKGLRLRGGGIIDFSWNAQGLVNSVKVVKKSKSKADVHVVDINGKHLTDI